MTEPVANNYLMFLEKNNQYPVQKEFEFIVKVEAEYNEIIEKIRAKKLIIKRLKALVVNWEHGNNELTNTEITEFFTHFFLDLENHPKLKGNIKTVGYLVSEVCEYGVVKFGASICKPGEYKGFNRKLGITIAYENMQLHEMPVFPARRYLCGNNSPVSYIWLDTPQSQFCKFTKNAYDYFKVYKQEEK